MDLNKNDWLFAKEEGISFTKVATGPYSLGNLVQCSFSYSSLHIGDSDREFSWDSFERCNLDWVLNNSNEFSRGMVMIGFKDIVRFIIDIYRSKEP